MIQKKLIETNEPLTSADFINRVLSVEIISIPKLIQTKYIDDQPILVVKTEKAEKKWFANWTSFNAMLDKFGNDESKMVGRRIDLVLIELIIDDRRKDVIFLKGSR